MQMNVYRRAIRKTRFLWSYLRSLFLCGWRKERYRNINSFLMFIGYPRSGHSLIAALMDAHPNIVVSMEWGALSHLRMGYRRLQIFYSIERFSRLFTEKLSNIWTGYSYRVEGQWQGKSDQILVIGDKLAGQTSMILREHPELLVRLKNEINADLKIIHVIRNPYDTIATVAKRALEKSSEPKIQSDPDYFSKRYFERAEMMKTLKRAKKYPILDLYHEDFIADPEKGLKALMDFLQLDFTGDYLEKCSAIVYERPHMSRKNYNWPEELKAEVQSRIDSYEFLSRYTFDD